MRLLALDLGTRTGWAAGDGSRLPSVGSRLNPYGAADIEALYENHEKWLLGLLADFKPRVVAYEEPNLPKKTNLDALSVTIGLAAITGLTCWKAKVVLRKVPAQRAKLALSGRGNADKDAMVNAARGYGYEIKFHDEADAFAVWLTTFRAFEPEKAVRFDPLFFRPEGESCGSSG